MLVYFRIAPTSVAQPDRAGGFYPPGWGFDSSRRYTKSATNVPLHTEVKMVLCGRNGNGYKQ